MLAASAGVHEANAAMAAGDKSQATETITKAKAQNARARHDSGRPYSD